MKKLEYIIKAMVALTQRGLPNDPGRNAVVAHAAYVSRYTKALALMDDLVDEFLELIGKAASPYDQEYAQILERALEHKTAADQTLGAIKDQRDVAQVDLLRGHFVDRVLGLEQCANALQSVVDRIKE